MRTCKKKKKEEEIEEIGGGRKGRNKTEKKRRNRTKAQPHVFSSAVADASHARAPHSAQNTISRPSPSPTLRSLPPPLAASSPCSRRRTQPHRSAPMSTQQQLANPVLPKLSPCYHQPSPFATPSIPPSSLSCLKIEMRK